MKLTRSRKTNNGYSHCGNLHLTTENEKKVNHIGEENRESGIEVIMG